MQKFSMSTEMSEYLGYSQRYLTYFSTNVNGGRCCSSTVVSSIDPVLVLCGFLKLDLPLGRSETSVVGVLVGKPSTLLREPRELLRVKADFEDEGMGEFGEFGDA